MEQLVKFRKTIAVQMLVMAVIVGFAALALGYKAGAKGFVLGSLFSFANFLIMYRQAPGRLGKERKAASVYSGFSMVVRMGLLAVPMYLAYRLPQVDLLWTAIGIFNLQISILIYGFVVERFFVTDGPAGQGR